MEERNSVNNVSLRRKITTAIQKVKVRSNLFAASSSSTISVLSDAVAVVDAIDVAILTEDS